MKKYVIGLIILSLLIFTGCSKNEDENQETNPELQTETPEVQPETNPEEQSTKEESRIDQFPEATQGKFTDLSITFGDNKEKVLKELGNPDEITTWQGSELYIYDNVGIYIDPNEEIVTGLTAGENYQTYGIKIGMTADEIKNTLGKPDFEGENVESGAYVVEYEAGEYIIEIAFHPDTKKSAGITLYRYNY